MRPSIRFLGLAVVGWAGFRAATLGVLPGAELFEIERSEAKPPPILATEFPPIEPVEPAQPFTEDQQAFAYAGAPQAFPPGVRPVAIPVYYPVPTAAPAVSPPARPERLTNILPQPAPNFYGPIPTLDEWPLSRIAATSMPMRSSVTVPGQSVPATFKTHRLDRLQLTSWALLRGQQGLSVGATSLASGGTLGGSQAGARLTYNFTRQIAATFRTSSEVGRRGGELAAGAKIQPMGGIPVWFTVERRQRLGQYGGGRNSFALFFEGGVYDRPMPMRFNLDAYLQGGVVGFRSRDGFVDGGLTLTRPIYRNFSAGLGVWGGAQPGLSRIDAGPRMTMRVRNNVRVHLDWRQQLAGNAQPGSGPAVTLAGDF